MDPTETTTPRVLRRLIAPARAGAITAGGSLVGLSLALWLDVWLGASRASFRAWIALTVGAAILGVVRPGVLRDGRDLLDRLLGAFVLGFALAASVFVPIVAFLRLPGDGTTAIAFSTAAGLGMLLAGLRHPSPSIVAVPVQVGPGGLLPAPPVAREEPGRAYGIAVNGPPLTPAESERDDLAVEVRVRWGADLLRVVHLDPPRSFTIGDLGSDLVVDLEALGSTRARLVAVSPSGPVAVAPPGTRALIRVGARQLTLAQALADGVATLSGEAASVPLALGVTVSVALAPGATAAAYRVAHTGADDAGARVVLEVSLVRAGRVVGRELSLGGAGRLVACTMVTAVAMLGGLGGLAVTAPVSALDDGEVSSDQKLLMMQQLQSFAEKEMEEAEQDQLALPGDHHDTEEGRLNPSTRGTWLSYPSIPFAESRSWEEQTGLVERPFDQPAGPDSFGPMFFCGAMELDDDRRRQTFPRARTRYCDTQVVTPFGLRALGAPMLADLLGRDPRDPWPFDLARSPGAARSLDGRAVVHVRRTDAPRPFASSALDRAVRGRQHDLEVCYALALAENPRTEGRGHARIELGLDGRMRVEPLSVSSALFGTARDCMQAAFEGPSRARPPRVERSQFELEVRPGPMDARPRAR
jgi:hypothetical protein